MGELKEKLTEEIRNNGEQIGENDIRELSKRIEVELEETTFIERLSSPATIIAAIVGYAVGGQLPDDALIQVATAVLVAATTEHIISSVEKIEYGVSKYREEDVKRAYRDVDRIYSIAKTTLSRDEQVKARMEASAYRAMMRNPRTRILIM